MPPSTGNVPRRSSALANVCRLPRRAAGDHLLSDMCTYVAEDLRGEASVMRGLFVAEIRNAEDLCEYVGARSQGVASDDSYHRYRAGALLDDGGQLAAQSLVVQLAFAGDDEVGAVQVGIKIEELEEILCARYYGAAEEHRSETASTGRSRARGGGQCRRGGPTATTGRCYQLGEAVFEVVDFSEGGPLLPRKDRCGSGWAGERVGDVAGDQQLDVPKRNCTIRDDVLDPVQVVTAW